MANIVKVNGSKVIIVNDTTGAVVDIGVIKNGHNETGHSEPFIADVDMADGALTGHAGLVFNGKNDDAKNTIADAIRIENTGYKNSVSWGIVHLAEVGDMIITVVDNPSNQFRIGDVIEIDHTGTGTNVRLYNVTAVDSIGINADGKILVELTIGVALNATVVPGRTIRTTGRKLYLGDGAISTDIGTVKAGSLVCVPVSPVTVI